MYYTSPACTVLFFYMYASWSWETSRRIRVSAGYIRCNSTKAHTMCVNTRSNTDDCHDWFACSSVPLTRDWNVIPPLPHPRNPRPDARPTQQPHRRADKDEDNRLVLGRVSLEARRQDVLFLFALAEAIAQAELAVAVVAGFLGRAGAEIGRRGLLDRRGGIEGDNGAVAEAGAFTEGRWCWLMSVH
jgi:hypothetical protein